MKILIGLIFSLMILGCSSQNLDDYANSSPKFDVESYFKGPLQAQGIVLDRGGKVTRRFTVEMIGTWTGNQGKLEEWFVFDDGEKTTRTWQITKLKEGHYIGTAGDVVGKALGESNGFALHWDYQLDLPVDGKEVRVTFDDWLYQVDNKVVINRSVITKWGFRVGEVILVITKK
ncbi:DUF3833 domain-containing protein [Psychromonas sp. MB-3u-54]|uniref:DUF3833 domain-containing protein n=1 Tax=Psychromonas sp. MB-3u-54 TaxID=2058319 RepID=UPI000C324BEF|nr:DUF3833 domain-containing protein [Psychromonas sp. MB-3u-54]PKH02925.1 DUF3833 domain-containing protein [Psychromonas sp. MB-3u-54]